jgi:hypothetical protein
VGRVGRKSHAKFAEQYCAVQTEVVGHVAAQQPSVFSRVCWWHSQIVSAYNCASCEEQVWGRQQVAWWAELGSSCKMGNLAMSIDDGQARNLDLIVLLLQLPVLLMNY